MRVLIADGDEGFLEILQCYLWDRGHEAETAGDGLECITILEEFKPEIVLLERELLWTNSPLRPFASRNGFREGLEQQPFWSGSQGVLNHMQSAPAFSETHVIMMACGGPLDNYDPLLNPPLFGWLRKPFRLSDLLEQIRSAGRVMCSSDLSAGAR